MRIQFIYVNYSAKSEGKEGIYHGINGKEDCGNPRLCC